MSVQTSVKRPPTVSGGAEKGRTKTITSLALLCAIAYAVMLLSKLLPNVNGFLSLDFKDVIIVIGAFLFGPVAGASMSIIVSLIETLTVSATGPVGLLMNILSTCAFACTAAFVYQRSRTRKGAAIGLVLGVALMTGVMLLWNYLITPIYQGVERDVVAAMLVPVFLPFNLLKGTLNAVTTMLLYKPIVTALRKANLVSEQRTASKTGWLLFAAAVVATVAMLVMVKTGTI